MRVHLRHMNKFRLFYDIHSITFLLYTLKLVILRLIMLLSRVSKTIRPFILPRLMSKQSFSENFHFYSCEKFLYIAWACFRNVARASIVSVISSFLQLHRQRKMAARFFLHGDHREKVVLSGTPLLRPVQYHRMFLDSVQYEIYFMFSPMQIQWNHFLGI